MHTTHRETHMKDVEKQRDSSVTMPKVNLSNSRGNLIYHIQILQNDLKKKSLFFAIHFLALIRMKIDFRSFCKANQAEKVRPKQGVVGCEELTHPLQRFKHKQTPGHTCRHQPIASAGERTRFKQHHSFSLSFLILLIRSKWPTTQTQKTESVPRRITSL